MKKDELLELRDKTAVELFNDYKEDFESENVELDDVKNNPATITDLFVDDGNICFDLGYISAVNHLIDIAKE
jgi:hypothetical protein